MAAKTSNTNMWKLQDAKTQFSELVRRARAGDPQLVTVHGKQAVVVFDPERYEICAKAPRGATLAGFVEQSKKYRGAAEGANFERPTGMTFRVKRGEIFVSVDGKVAADVPDPERSEIRPKARAEATLAGFVERSKKYRG